MYKEITEKYFNLPYKELDAVQYQFEENTNELSVIFNEAVQWMMIGLSIQQHNIFLIQSYVLLTLSIELFLKMILLNSHIIIPKTHNLYKLFISLPQQVKQELEQKIDLSIIQLIDQNNIEIGNLSNFEEFLKYISNQFVELRYDFEKVNNHISSIIPRKFINDFNFQLFLICLKIYEDFS